MANIKTHTTQRAFLVLLMGLFVVFYFFLAIAGFEVFSERDRLSSATDVDSMSGRLTPLFYQINIFPSQVAQEVLFLSKFLSFRNDIDDSSPHEYESLINDLLTSVQDNNIYHEVRYIDNSGAEKLRIAYDDKEYYVTPRELLDKEVKDKYIEDIQILSEGDVYIAPITLADRVHPVRNRPVSLRDISVSMIRFGTPVYSNKEKIGVVVADIHADYFLDDIRRASHDNEKLYLIDQYGQYLAHPDPQKEYGTLLKTYYNFRSDYPEVADEVLSRFEKRIIESDTTVFSMRRIFPATANFALSNGAQKLHGINPNRDFFWILVSVTEKENLLPHRSIFNGYKFFMGFSGLLIILILGMFVIILEIIRRRKSP